MGDDVDVEVGAGLAGHGGADARSEDGLPGAAAADAEHDLRGIAPAREFQQRVGDAVAYDVVEGAAEVFHQGPLDGEFLGEAEVRPSLAAM